MTAPTRRSRSEQVARLLQRLAVKPDGKHLAPRLWSQRRRLIRVGELFGQVLASDAMDAEELAATCSLTAEQVRALVNLYATAQNEGQP